ncbi:hypothetical protein MferCBS31731_005886 [Microsporum ferrugineum]
MSLPPPPGLQRPPPSQTAPQAQQPPASLPARPPSTASSYTAAAAPATVSRPPSHGPDISRPAVGAAYGFQPRAVAAQSYRAPAYPTYNNNTGYQYQQQQQQHQPHHQHQQTYQAQPTSYYGQQTQQSYNNNTSTYNQHNGYPQKRNNAGSYGARSGQSRYGESTGDPEMDAQIAQWQSAYMSKDGSEAAAAATPSSTAATGANSGPLGSIQRLHDPSASTASTPPSGAATTAAGTPLPIPNQGLAAAAGQESSAEPTKTVLRSGGGQTWTDSTLLEWDPAHFRLFCGNLAGEVTDESLLKAFSKYPSVQKARVIRDKRTEKSKGYGFVSFSDGDDYFKAAREMQGKYIGSHPVLLRRAMTEIRPVSASKGKHAKGKGRHGHHHSSGSGIGRENKPAAVAPGKTDGGVKKQKTKGGLRVLG